MTTPSQTLAQTIRSRREARGLSVLELARLVGVSEVTFWKCEKGTNKPRQQRLDVLAQALNVAPVELASLDKAYDPRSAPIDRRGQADLPGPASPTSLSDAITKAKQMIARASGAFPQNITVIIAH